ncbi:DNA cytosine methyltransferase [Streptomyces harbinensis]|uniref:DNA cytosine methyltransferase n=1 Tax=Streptomyces harbinensis TaxID=1176198 RepID=UPI0036B2283D
MTANWDAVDLFAGPGGWDLAAAAMGIRAVGLEWDASAVATRTAAGHATIRTDVAAYPTGPLAGIRGLIGSPPCQTFSSGGKRAGLSDMALVHQAIADLAAGRDTRAALRSACADERSLLAAEPVRYAAAMRPEWVALEQVPAALPLWQQAAEILRGWGYSTWTGILNAADYGVPQTRRRAILIASRVRQVAPPAPTHAEAGGEADLFGPGLPQWVSMADALDLEPGLVVNTRGERRTAGGNEFPADRPSWALTEKARSWWVLRHGKRANATVRRLDEPAATILGGHARRDYEWHTVGVGPVQRRLLAIAEASVLQGFPAAHPWFGSESRQFLQIGNAVPPPLAAAVLSAATGIPAAVPHLAVTA